MNSHDDTETSGLMLDRFHEIEIEKLFDAIASAGALRVQIGVFIATVNLAALGISVTAAKAAVVLFAAALPLILIAVDFKARQGMAYQYLRLFKLQATFAPDDAGFAYTSTSKSRQWARKVMRLAQADDTRAAAPPRITVHELLSFTGFWLPLAATMAEVALALVLWLGFSWEFL